MRTAWPSCAGLILLLAIGKPLLADKAKRPPTPQEISKWIAQLADENYYQREAASQRLIEIGGAAQDLLEAARSDGNLEIRYRAERLVTVIYLREIEARLEAFAKDVDGSENISLPGWKRYRQIVGSSRRDRALFVEMQRAERHLLDAYERNPETVRGGLELRSRKHLESLHLGAGDACAPASMAAMWLVAGDEKIKLTEQTAACLNHLLSFTQFESTLNNPENAPLRKLFCSWVSSPAGGLTVRDKVTLVDRFGLRNEYAEVARTLKRKETVGTFGGMRRMFSGMRKRPSGRSE